MDSGLVFTFIDIFVNLDKYLVDIISNYGTWVYLIIFVVIFCETGLVVTPFLPGDSLIFILGALAAGGEINIVAIGTTLMSAAVLGNVVNYQIGSYIGPRIFTGTKIRFLNESHLLRTHAFYEKHGGKTIVMARFLPIIRTFAPFVAGIGGMHKGKFLIYNFAGSVSWVTLFLWGGWAFGNIPIVERNLSLVVFGIIFVTCLPALIGLLKEKFKKPPQPECTKAEG